MTCAPSSSRAAVPRLIAMLAGVATLVLLAGCGGDPAPAYAQAFGFQCAHHKDGTSNRLCAKGSDPGAAEVSRYCYRTLGGPNCFDRPDPDSKNQALGSSGY